MFEVYEKKIGSGRTSEVPFVSINPQGLFRFNIKSIEQFIQNKTFAIVYLDKQAQKIGFTFIDTASAANLPAAKLCKCKNHFILNGKSIIDKLKYKITKTKQYELKVDNDIVYLQLIYDY